MNDRIRDAYIEHELALAKAGILDHSLNIAILDGKTVEEHMIDVLRAAGKLPVDSEREMHERRTA